MEGTNLKMIKAEILLERIYIYVTSRQLVGIPVNPHVRLWVGWSVIISRQGSYTFHASIGALVQRKIQDEIFGDVQADF